MTDTGSGKIIPIRLKSDDLIRAEAAAALAGYRHLSTFLRDRALNQQDASPVLADVREELAELAGQIAQLGKKVDMALFLLLRRVSDTEKVHLREIIAQGGPVIDLLGE